MKAVKAFVLRHFELAVVVVLVLATAFAVLIAGNKVAFLNVFYIPVLIAAYFLGRDQGVMAAVAGVLMVSIYAILQPDLFAGAPTDLPWLNVALWGASIVVTAFVVGSLYEVKESAVRDLKQAYQGVLAILAKFVDAVDSSSREHSLRVSTMACEIAGATGLPATSRWERESSPWLIPMTRWYVTDLTERAGRQPRQSRKSSAVRVHSSTRRWSPLSGRLYIIKTTSSG